MTYRIYSKQNNEVSQKLLRDLTIYFQHSFFIKTDLTDFVFNNYILFKNKFTSKFDLKKIPELFKNILAKKY